MTASYSPSRSLKSKITRRLTQWRVSDPLGVRPKKPVISFTFDDFPKSAAVEGSRILESVGGRGTFYASTSLAGTTNATGLQFDKSDITNLLNAGHEIGAHTHTHLDCAKAKLSDIRDDIQLNMRHLEAMGVKDINQFAYPYGETRVELKNELTDWFETARGVLPGVNSVGSDRLQLRAFELTRDPTTIRRAGAAIRAAQKRPTWIVFFTHDVSKSPSPFGTYTQDLQQLAEMARDIGADITSVGGAFNTLRSAKAANDA